MFDYYSCFYVVHTYNSLHISGGIYMKNTDDYIKEGYREYRKWGSWNTVELILILILLFVCGFILYNYMQEHNKTIEAEKKIETMEKEIGAETTVKGVPVDSDTEIDITSIINQYFTRVREGSGWIELDNYCASGSTVYKTESGYRIRSKESYDTDDCLSRGIKEFATFIKLNRITNITEDEGIYYAYCNITTVDVTRLPEFYSSYGQELIYWINGSSLSYGEMTKFVIKNLKSYSPPTIEKDIVIQLNCNNGEYKIVSDAEILGLAQDPYITCISTLIDVLGRYQSSEYYK